jgi:hypothetical protein
MSVASKFPSIDPTLMLDFANTGVLDPRITFTRATTATYFNALGVLTTAASGSPRFDYNPSTLQPLGLLIEEARTNSIRNNTMQGAVAGTPGTVPTNWTMVGSVNGITRQIIGTGTENGIDYIDVKYSGTPSATFSVVIRSEQNTQIVAASGQTWAASFYVKLVGGSLTNLGAIGIEINGWTAAGAFVEQSSSVVVVPTSAALSTQRGIATYALANASTARVNSQVSFALTNGSAIDITLRIGLPQLEQGAFATSVIPTTTTALTRNADVASMTGTNFSSWYNATQGTLFAQFLRTATVNSQQGRVFSLSNASNTALIEIYQTSGNDPAAQIINTSTQAQWTPTGFTVGISVKEILAYKLNDSNASFNGSAETSDTACTIPTVTQANIGNRQDGVRALNGYIQRIAYYPTRLTNAQLQALTA